MVVSGNEQVLVLGGLPAPSLRQNDGSVRTFPITRTENSGAGGVTGPRSFWHARAIAQMPYGDEIHPGEHGAIVAESTWRQAQVQLQRQTRRAPPRTRNPEYLLRGLLRCACCGEKQ